MVVRGNRWLRDPERGKPIRAEEGRIQQPDVVVINDDDNILLLIGEATSGSQENLESRWDQLEQRQKTAEGKADDAVLVLLTENERGERKGFIKNGEANPKLADKIGAALNDQGITTRCRRPRSSLSL